MLLSSWHEQRSSDYSEWNIDYKCLTCGNLVKCWKHGEKLQCKTLINCLWFAECFSTVGANVFMGKNYSDNLHSVRNTRKGLSYQSRCSTCLKSWWWTIRWDFWSVSNQLGKFSMETIVPCQWCRSHQSLVCTGSCVLRFCVLLEMWIRTQEMENRWNSSGIFFQDWPHCSISFWCSMLH